MLFVFVIFNKPKLVWIIYKSAIRRIKDILKMSWWMKSFNIEMIKINRSLRLDHKNTIKYCVKFSVHNNFAFLTFKKPKICELLFESAISWIEMSWYVKSLNIEMIKQEFTTRSPNNNQIWCTQWSTFVQYHILLICSIE